MKELKKFSALGSCTPRCVIIASIFIAGVLICSGISRYLRSTELRVSEVTFADDETARLWQGLTGKKVNLVPLRTNFWRDLFKQRLVSFAMVIGVSFVLLVSLILSTVLALIIDYFSYLLPGADIFWQFLDVGLSFSIITFVFALIFKIVPDVHIDWRDVWLGALVTALLFVAGKTAIGYYLGRSGVESAYGAAGSVLVLLAWVYYSSQILFFGAEFTKLHAEESRSRIKPPSRCGTGFRASKTACSWRETSETRRA